MISQYSPTQIGCGQPEMIKASRQKFQEESKIVLNFLKESHHARKLAHMQVHYPSTVSTLGKKNKAKKEEDQHQPRSQSKFHDLESEKYKKFVTTVQANIIKEYEVNQRKRAHNHNNGNKSVAYDIVKGSAPLGKEYFFPHKASHQQILALTGTLGSSDANIIPPKVPPRKKWLGDEKGWSDSTS